MAVPQLGKKDAQTVIDQFVKSALDLKSNKLTEAKLRELAPAILQELLKYLKLKIDAKKPLGPTSDVIDNMWHAFVLCSESYVKFCEKENGSYLHHLPSAYIPGTPAGDKAYAVVIEAYRASYGEPPSVYWPQVPASASASVGKKAPTTKPKAKKSAKSVKIDKPKPEPKPEPKPVTRPVRQTCRFVAWGNRCKDFAIEGEDFCDEHVEREDPQVVCQNVNFCG